MIKPVVTWILVADAGHARVIAHNGPGLGLHPVPGHNLEHPVPSNQDLMADREGRSFSSHGDGRSAMERPSDPVRLEKRAFATRLAAMLSDELRKGSFDRLIIIAAPRALGDLRAALSDQVRRKVNHEIDKDLTHVGLTDLVPFLEPVLAV